MELQRLRTVFRTALELPEDAEVESLEYRGIEQWDSLAHMSLVAAIEDEFDVMLETDEVIDLSSFDRARQILEKHGTVLTD
ncbi:acyl carrier protein [Micromonospora musae]|uniref:Acyl carrier protein n=1 Tax=Micromonospora musae TaxID=1894970 RepID=A0A3A9YE05_9ACTN|nr:acyl carrier protein [Micromonospora musae]RKN14922.1 acyl carrier protein [Micromonospora musae]RKN35451.1 acyl carrier protein [Micromonospora musae]